VLIYSKHLKFIESFKLDYKPWKIKTSCSIILIASGTGPDLYVYNLHNFIFKKKFTHEAGRISEINSFFYEFNHKTKKMFCYDENANLKEEIVLNGLEINYLTDAWDGGSLIVFNNKLLMTSAINRKLIEFNK
jgi:hypothetical protein